MTAFSRQLLARLAAAEYVTVFTGAGISAESGVPTFRSGNDGIWKKFKPEELATFDAFMANPALVSAWYRHRRQLMSGVSPNAGHYAIAALEKRHRRVAVVTQNIDNLHRRAGSTTIHELHGNIERNYCVGCGKFAAELSPAEEVPRCPSCGSLVRPDVVWFGEMLPEDAWSAGVDAAKMADVFLAVGTSAVVYPAASLPGIARHAGAYLVEINVERTELSADADEVLTGKSGEILPALLDAYTKQP